MSVLARQVAGRLTRRPSAPLPVRERDRREAAGRGRHGRGRAASFEPVGKSALRECTAAAHHAIAIPYRAAPSSAARGSRITCTGIAVHQPRHGPLAQEPLAEGARRGARGGCAAGCRRPGRRRRSASPRSAAFPASAPRMEASSRSVRRQTEHPRVAVDPRLHQRRRHVPARRQPRGQGGRRRLGRARRPGSGRGWRSRIPGADPLVAHVVVSTAAAAPAAGAAGAPRGAKSVLPALRGERDGSRRARGPASASPSPVPTATTARTPPGSASPGSSGVTWSGRRWGTA